VEEQYINSIVGNHSLFKGDIDVEGLVRIDGDFAGNIRRANRVLIGSQGRADAKVNAKVVVVGGAFHGSMYASERIILLAGSVVIGSLFSPRILVEPGAILDCALSVTGVPEEATTNRPSIFARAGRTLAARRERNKKEASLTEPS